ncbi:hypothetical protein GWO60_08920 [Corynebacterium macginleyi]|uniref:Uncharacterized protein n=1 Tax=Corynebacterium macginleyi TaxID=38290 RepID=A0ABS1Y7T5_9CORY|nr:hypothetical protein [Corynebacterium macginleyi]MBK4174627.1 hypothetical protein [Corynebacterium macginleyi]MBM0244457.1 hypothetical protein [Corynebacterium macginleyi]
MNTLFEAVGSAPTLDFSPIIEPLQLLQGFLVRTAAPCLVLVVVLVVLVELSWRPLLLLHYRRVAERQGYQRDESGIWAYLRGFRLVARRHKLGVSDPRHTPNPGLTGEDARKDKPRFLFAERVGKPQRHDRGIALAVKPAYGQSVRDLASQLGVRVAPEIRQKFAPVLQGEEVIIEENSGRVLLIVQTMIPGQQQPSTSLLD